MSSLAPKRRSRDAASLAWGRPAAGGIEIVAMVSVRFHFRASLRGADATQGIRTRKVTRTVLAIDHGRNATRQLMWLNGITATKE